MMANIFFSFMKLFLMCSFVNVLGQQGGVMVPEESPSFTVNFDGNCTQQLATLDGNWRWLHYVDSYRNCVEGPSTWTCGSPESCSEHCALEGIDASRYDNTYGIKTLPTGIEMRYVSETNSVGSRLYMVDPETKRYNRLKLKNKELSIDVDVSELPCGLNSALYLVRIDDIEGRLESHGASYGDAQCPKDLKFVSGLANVKSDIGSCATEIDLIEANSESLAWTLHPCKKEGPCRGDQCNDFCDKNGADSNSYREGFKDFYGPNKKLNSRKPFTAVTQFITADGSDDGLLVEIKRFYVQDGVKIVSSRESITDSNAAEQFTKFGERNTFEQNGGMTSLSKAMDDGLVLVFSIWDDPSTGMKWLDSFHAGSERGPCPRQVTPVNELRQRYGHVKSRFTNLVVADLSSN